jgi:hypothetical protein
MRLLLLTFIIAVAPVSAQDDFDAFDDDWEEQNEGLPINGFIETAYGRKLHNDPNFSSRQSLGDIRAQLETQWSTDTLRINFKGEGLYDNYESEFDGLLRELNVQLSPADSIDLKVGRQVLTWGTGDLLFLNDLFPKSWVSFFSGRDDDYLKAPSDAVRMTWYTSSINIDAVWSPQFEPDDYLTGTRFSFFSPIAGSVVAPRPPLSASKPSGGLNNGELAVRLFSTTGASEYAAYYYRGFFKRPLGLDAILVPNFPALSVYGASLRRPLASGLFNAEFAYHQSREDKQGSSPLVPNDQVRVLLGYEFEARPRFTVGVQYYLEWTQDYGALLSNSPAQAFEPDERRHLLTNRLTYRTNQDKLTLSLFTFFSPSDSDYYMRPSIVFRQNDNWSFSGGANLFGGQQQHTFFGQLEDNSNAYFRVRFNY